MEFRQRLTIFIALVIGLALTILVAGLTYFRGQVNVVRDNPPQTHLAVGINQYLNTYESTLYGFQFNYPDGGQVEDYTRSIGAFDGGPSPLLAVAFCYPPSAEQCTTIDSLTVERTQATDPQGLTCDFASFYHRPVQVVSRKQMLIAGTAAIVSEVRNRWFPDKDDTWIQLIHNGNLISWGSFAYGSDGEHPVAQQYTNSFVSTLKLK
jgi:hypothetical protein